MIQVGAFDDEGDAKDRLAAAHSKAKARARRGRPASPKRSPRATSTLYRARFAGLDKDAGRSRLQTPQAQRNPVYVAEKLTRMIAKQISAKKIVDNGMRPTGQEPP